MFKTTGRESSPFHGHSVLLERNNSHAAIDRMNSCVDLKSTCHSPVNSILLADSDDESILSELSCNFDYVRRVYDTVLDGEKASNTEADKNLEMGTRSRTMNTGDMISRPPSPLDGLFEDEKPNEEILTEGFKDTTFFELPPPAYDSPYVSRPNSPNRDGGGSMGGYRSENSAALIISLSDKGVLAHQESKKQAE